MKLVRWIFGAVVIAGPIVLGLIVVTWNNAWPVSADEDAQATLTFHNTTEHGQIYYTLTAGDGRLHILKDLNAVCVVTQNMRTVETVVALDTIGSIEMHAVRGSPAFMVKGPDRTPFSGLTSPSLSGTNRHEKCDGRVSQGQLTSSWMLVPGQENVTRVKHFFENSIGLKVQ